MGGLQVLSDYVATMAAPSVELVEMMVKNQLADVTPYHVLTAVLIAPLGGFIFRIRGGYLAPYIGQVILKYGATKSRLLAAFLFASVASVVATDPMLLLMTVPIYVGFPMGWFHAADIGRDGDRPWLTELALMTVRGILLTLVGGVALLAIGYGGAYLACGMLLGVMYDLGHRVKVDIPHFRTGMELGEFFTGCILMGSLFLAATTHNPRIPHLVYQMWLTTIHAIGTIG